MSRKRPRLFVLALLAVGLTPVWGESEPPEDETTYAPMPWHLVDTWWDISESTPFESLAVEVTISDDVPASVNLYIAPIGLGHLSETPFYGGIQTQADGNTRDDKRLRSLGPGFLFSRWGERGLDAIRPSDGGFLQSSGHEGDFVSVRRPYLWTKGKYTYRLTRMDRELIDDQPYTWVGAFVYSHEKNENVFVGALRFKGEQLVLDRKVANFVEVYGRRRPVARIPKVTVSFGPPIVNGKVAKIRSAAAIYPKNVPDYANAVVNDGSLVITVGAPVQGRQQRQVKLIDDQSPPRKP